MGISLLGRPVDQQQRQLAVRFYSMCYCAMSGVDVLGGSSWLQTYIVCESMNIKVFQYQVMISNDLFEKTNEEIFSKYFKSLLQSITF